jgi:hypothetical protein
VPAYPIVDLSLFNEPMDNNPNSDSGKALARLLKTPCSTGFAYPGMPSIE